MWRSSKNSRLTFALGRVHTQFYAGLENIIHAMVPDQALLYRGHIDLSHSILTSLTPVVLILLQRSNHEAVCLSPK